jgi:aerobic carbon-monoxide dehydrogenase medium subunit
VYASPFAYRRVASWAEAIDALQEHGEDARLLAGGQSLVPMMNLRLAQPSHVIDLNGIESTGISSSDGVVEVDALTRHSELEGSPVVADACPMLSDAAGMIGNVRVRHRGTIGGSVAHADPSAELPCALVALRAEIRVLGSDGERRIPASDFFVSFFTTALDTAEVVVGVEVPVVPGSSGSAFLEVARRTGDFAIVEVAALLGLDASGSCMDVRVALGGIGDRPLDLSESAAGIVGTTVEDEQLKEVARAVAGATEPRGDERGSADYRRHLSEVLTGRALRSAREQAQAGAGR